MDREIAGNGSEVLEFLRRNDVEPSAAPPDADVSTHRETTMRVAVLGLGYVGFTAACCIASQGHVIVGVDINQSKLRDLRAGVAPITEPGVDELLLEARGKGVFEVTSEIGPWLAECDIALVCVGTPSGPDGAHDMRHIIEVSHQIAAALNQCTEKPKPLTVVYRSTIRPGSVEELIAPIFRAHLGDDRMQAVELVYNPEFLREASAVEDYFHPPKIVIGTADGRPSKNMDALYAGIDAPVFYTRYREAEITKFVDNSWHAVKVAFANEIGRVCLQLGISARKMHEIFVSDTKLNVSPYYLRPGGAFGGSCLPKDVRALQYISADCGANTPLIDSLLRSNEAHKFRLFQRAVEGLQPGASILLAGISFKAGTDDLRESPNVDLARALLREGYQVSIFDPSVNATKLVGANLGYAFANLPTLERLLVTKEQAEAMRFDRVVASNATVRTLALPQGQDVIDLGTLA
jgi:GDP-mannose 6-dehydrogenase